MRNKVILFVFISGEFPLGNGEFAKKEDGKTARRQGGYFCFATSPLAI
jgi:hypothetical protein